MYNLCEICARVCVRILTLSLICRFFFSSSSSFFCFLDATPPSTSSAFRFLRIKARKLYHNQIILLLMLNKTYRCFRLLYKKIKTKITYKQTYHVYTIIYNQDNKYKIKQISTSSKIINNIQNKIAFYNLTCSHNKIQDIKKNKNNEKYKNNHKYKICVTPSVLT